MSGRITDASTAAPLYQATVVLEERSAAAGRTRGTATDRDGRYTLSLPGPGAYVLVVRHVGYETARFSVEASARDTTTASAALVPVTLDAGAITVEASRNPLLDDARAVSVLAPDALDNLRGQTLGETLESLPGVTTLTTGPSISKPVIRGLHSDRVVVLNHGITQEGQQWGGEHAPEIDPFAPAEIRVVKGAAGVEHGAGAIGGVVELVPPSLPEAPGVSGEVAVNGFTNNRQGAGSLRLEGGLPNGVGWRVQSSVRRAGDAHTPSRVITNSSFAERSLAATLGYQRGRWRTEVHASRFDTELGIYSGAHVKTLESLRRVIEDGPSGPPRDFSYSIGPPKQSVTHDLVSLQTDWTTSAGTLHVQYGMQRNQRQEFDAHCRFCDSPGSEPAFDLTLITHTLDATWRAAPRPDMMLAVGLSGKNQGNANGESGYLIPNFRAYTGGGFAHAHWTTGDWRLEAGLRADHRWMRAFPRALGTGEFEADVTENTGLSAVVGSLWQFAPQWSVAAHAATAWRPPNVNELHSAGVHHGSAQFERGDPTLNAERLHSTDLSLRHQSPRWHLNVSGYAKWGRDFIQLVPSRDTVVTIRGVFPAFGYQQSGVTLRGVDGRVAVDLTRTLRTGVSGALVRATNTDTSEPVFGMPSDRATLFAELQLPSAGRFAQSALRFETTAVRQQTRVPPNTDFAPPPAGYTVLGASAQSTVHVGGQPVHLHVSVDNLLNTAYRDFLSRYRYYIDEPGRTVVLRLRVPFGT